jgi:NAD(P)-dependent dehydrogenase (short-subunit alcohol dehydrogenase family)
MTHRRAVVVTGGGSGIGAAIAESIGRTGAHVITVDPLLSLDGTEHLPGAEETTADRIVAAGGSARASNTSVTDRDDVEALFQEVAEEHAGLDAVVNVAGITRPTGFATGTADEWASILQVHLGGYLNVLGAALPLMAKAGRGHIVGVTSGSGWRAADSGAYSCAKRAVASLTWQLGAVAPEGVVVNAMSPIAATRMVIAAMERAKANGTATSLAFESMPEPEALGPFGAYLVDEAFTWCQGRVLFAGGPEVALVDEPRLLEVVRTDGAASFGRVLDAVVPGAWTPAEVGQSTSGGSTPRFPAVFDASGSQDAATEGSRCAVTAEDPTMAEAVTAALAGRGVQVVVAASAAALDDPTIDAVVVALSGSGQAPGSTTTSWERVLAEHQGLVDAIDADARWARAAADAGRPLRLVTLTQATTAGGKSRAQAAAQLSRVAPSATEDRVHAYSVAVESPDAADTRAAAELAAYLVSHPDARGLAGAELAVGKGWAGLRSHPRPAGTITFGGPDLPAWFDGALRALVEGR